jgi:uncharacterized membrane protein YfcA
LSASIGFSLGLIGGGGSIITVPVLVYVLGVEAHQAIGMSLAIVGVASLIGSILHYKKGSVNLTTGMLFGIIGMVGAYLGSSLTYFFLPKTLLFIFATLMIVISLAMLLKNNDKMESKKETSIGKAIIIGLIVGLLTGFLGVGGGFLIVPALVLFSGLEMKDAIGTSLLVISINCVAGLMGHLHHSKFNIPLTLLITTIAAIGTLLGTRLSYKVSPSALKKGFAIFVLVVGVFLIIKNY